MFVRFGCDKKYSDELERCLPDGDDFERQDAIQRLAFNLKLNHEFLQQKYRPNELVNLPDDMLIEKSPAEAEKWRLHKKQETYRLLTEKNFLAERGFSGDLGCMRCRSCGTQVESTVKQTRSADEGSTVIFHCPNPKCTTSRWKK